MPKFPDYFPPDAEEKIKARGGKYLLRDNIFRILRKGELNREAFLCSYKENENSGVRKANKQSIGSYSTSCYDSREAIEDRLKVSFKDEPKACIAKGTIDPSCGPSTDPNESRHIDWWIFEDAKPETYFRKDN